MPLQRVPVTTVPMPSTGKTRSMGRRAAPSSERPGASPAAASMAWIRSSMPAPVTEETATMGIPRSAVGRSSSFTSERIRGSCS